jgi:hypothetical protein
MLVSQIAIHRGGYATNVVGTYTMNILQIRISRNLFKRNDFLIELVVG